MIRSVGVVVPAANEEEHIGACLDALAAARTHLRTVAEHDVDVRIVLVLDSCVDGTAAVAQTYRGVESVACEAEQVGAARAVGTERLLADADLRRSQLWLANTDADSVVPLDWLARMVDEAERGAQLVLGTVLPMPGLAEGTERAWRSCHRLHENHPYVHGANLGLRADAYTALGGWPRLATGEDVVLAKRAACAGLRIVRTASIPVQTSVRLGGRAPRGFSSYLRGISSQGALLGSGDRLALPAQVTRPASDTRASKAVVGDSDELFTASR